ncbi:hypothetical protein [Tepidanaerobacter syntrophicus]|uniref:hypothetical protein n=1 Tax=Tepidanaerobacter syntrophicus TaxID=224999 RepID=UPI001BD2AFEF|nr:hypothetical protein [Tepidanaerobacter syntrophicus]
MQSWITENKNKDSIVAINFLVRKIVKTTNYSDKSEVSRNSKRVRNLLEQREKLYQEGVL